MVAIGVSARNVRGLGRILRKLPPRSGISYVVVQLDPERSERLGDILRRHTRLPLDEAREGARAEPDHVSIVPPGSRLVLERGLFRTRASMRSGREAPLGRFLRALAADQRERAVCVVLCGARAGIAVGVHAIKANGGLTLAQAPATAQRDRTLRGLVDAGLIDVVVPVGEIPERLLEHVRHASRILASRRGENDGLDRLNVELSATRARLAATVEELGGANEDLRTSNEQLVLTNEQLLSANERLLRSQAELHDREQRLRAIYDNAAVGIVEVDRDDRFVSANERALAILRYTREELLERTVHEITHPDDRPASDALNARIHQGLDSALHYEKRYLRRDGSPVWVHVTVSGVRDRDGHWVRSVGTIEDITERRRAEDVVRRQAAELEAVLDSLQDAVFVYDTSGRPLRTNPAASQLYGIDAAEGRTVERNAEQLRVRRVDGRPMSPEDLPSRRALQGERVNGEEYLLTGPDGTDHVVEASAAPFVVGEETVGVVSVARDITDRRRSEREVLRSREGLRRLAEASREVMARADLGGMLQAVAEAALALTGGRVAACGHGYVSGKYVVSGAAREPGSPVSPPEEMFTRGGILALAERAESFRLNDAELRAHEAWRGVPAAHAPLRGLLGARMTARDDRTSGLILVTDKEQGDFTVEDEALLRQLATVASLALQHVETRLSLEESDRRKDHFLAMLSHELRNPLSPIHNSLYILDHSPPGGEQARRAQSVISRQVGHMTKLVDELLDVTRISRGKIKLRRERLDLVDLVRRAIDDYRAPFAQSGIELQASLPAEPVWVDADRTRIAQVIGNLLSNAAKFTDPGGAARVSLVAGEEAVLRVRDTGAGIAPEMLPRVFEPFTQDDTTLDRSKGGLGLGLALVKGLVEMHGGTVDVESEAPGKGAEFTVRLPLQRRTVAAAEPPPVTSPPHQPRRVLVIEDNVDSAESLREVLELAQHTVAVAYSGPSGIERARVFAPDVILCDIGLPGMDGYEVARAMRDDPELRSTTLVALTGYAAPDDVARSREAGFDEHMPKPPSPEQLEAVLSRAGAVR